MRTEYSSNRSGIKRVLNLNEIQKITKIVHVQKRRTYYHF